jgi:hypothetical protein
MIRSREDRGSKETDFKRCRKGECKSMKWDEGRRCEVLQYWNGT